MDNVFCYKASTLALRPTQHAIQMYQSNATEALIWPHHYLGTK